MTSTPRHEPRVEEIARRQAKPAAPAVAAPHWAEGIARAQREAAAAEAQRQAAELETVETVERVFERDRAIFQDLLVEEIQRAAAAFRRGGGPALHLVATADRVSISCAFHGGLASVIFSVVERPAPALAVFTCGPGGRQVWPIADFAVTTEDALVVATTDGPHGPEDLVRVVLKPWLLRQLTL